MQIVIPYRSNMLSIKKLSHQRAASLLKLDNTVNNNSISNTKYAEFSINEEVFFSFSQLCAINSKLTSQFSLPCSTINYSRIHPSLALPSSISQQYFTSLLLAYNHPNDLHQNNFLYLNHLTSSGCTKEPGS